MFVGEMAKCFSDHVHKGTNGFKNAKAKMTLFIRKRSFEEKDKAENNSQDYPGAYNGGNNDVKKRMGYAEK